MSAWNSWRYWRPVMWWVSWRFGRAHAKTIQNRHPSFYGMPKMFAYPVIPGQYYGQYKFLRQVEVIFSPKAYRDLVEGARVYPLRLRPL